MTVNDASNSSDDDLTPGSASATARRIHRARRRVSNTPRGSYSRFVALAKLLLPTLAVALIATVFIWPQLRSQDSGFNLGFSELKIGDAESLRMINPRYIGLDQNQLPYEVTADVANQNSSKADNIELKKPKADMALSDRTWIVIEAPKGNYGQKTQLLDLSDGVNLFHDSGYEFNSPTARVDLTKGTAEGNERVVGHGPFGDAEGEGFRLLDKGKTIIFTGKSKVVLYSEGDNLPQPAAQKPSAKTVGRWP